MIEIITQYKNITIWVSLAFGVISLILIYWLIWWNLIVKGWLGKR